MKKPELKCNHKPVTRRDFIAQGLMQGMNMMLLPSLLELVVSRNAYAEDGCPSGGQAVGAGMMPFIFFDLPGGPMLSGNFGMPYLTGSTTLPSSFNRRGVPDSALAASPPRNDLFGNGGVYLNQADNQILAGLLETTSADTRSRMAVAFSTVRTQDDSSNPVSPVPLINQAGLQGSLVSTGLGASNSASGSNSQPAIPGPRPLRVTSINDLSGAASIGGALATLAPAQKEEVARAILNLSKTQKERLAGMTLGEQFGKLAECGYVKNIDFARDASALVNPNNSPEARTVYAGDPNTNIPNNRAADATVVHALAKGLSGPVALQRGGCDYHGNTRANTNAIDLDIGQRMGRAIELHARLGRPLYLVAYGDGAISTQADNPNPGGDSEGGSLQIHIAYLPDRRPQLVNNGVFGGFTSGQAVDQAAFGVTVPQMIAAIALANWLNLQGKLGEFTRHVSSTLVNPSDVPRLLLFG